MSDLISRRAVIEAIEQHKTAVLGEREWEEGIAWGYAAAHRHIVDIVKQLPSAQPEGCPFYIENKHDRGDDSLCRLFSREVKCLAIGTRQVGEWIDDNCSVCGQYVHHGDARNYCPRCGAYMMEGNNEVDHDRQAGQPDIGDACVRS